jgi:hypothetical protein
VNSEAVKLHFLLTADLNCFVDLLSWTPSFPTQTRKQIVQFQCRAVQKRSTGLLESKTSSFHWVWFYLPCTCRRWACTATSSGKLNRFPTNTANCVEKLLVDERLNQSKFILEKVILTRDWWWNCVGRLWVNPVSNTRRTEWDPNRSCDIPDGFSCPSPRSSWRANDSFFKKERES